MNKLVRLQLSLMMFLEFFIWGGWFVFLTPFLVNNLDAKDVQISTAFSTQSWGAIIAPFIIGLIADRFFNAERILGILHLVGAVLLYQMYLSTNFLEFYPFVLVYMIAYMPTLALVNSISFNQMKDPAKEFSFIRVFGTIGWIAAGLLISWLGWDSEVSVQKGVLKNMFLMAAIASGFLALFSFTLPRTPPTTRKGAKISIAETLGLDALSLLKDRNFLIFFLASVLICIPLAFYYQYTSLFLTEIKVKNGAGLMTIGQASEVLFLLLLPFFFKRFGFKWTIIVGMFAWTARYFLFAYGGSGELLFMLIIGIALHGVCYDFFFVSGQIYTDFKAGSKFKSSAQGLITLATYGVGMLVGFYIAGLIAEANVMDKKFHDWETIWVYPAAFAFGVLLLFALFFRNEKIDKKDIEI